jgi:hypothetical protein
MFLKPEAPLFACAAAGIRRSVLRQAKRNEWAGFAGAQAQSSYQLRLSGRNRKPMEKVFD